MSDYVYLSRILQPLTAEELARIKAEKRQRDHAKKQKISENR